MILSEGDLYKMISSACGMTPTLRLELFVIVAVRDKVVHVPDYKFTTLRRKRFKVAFIRSIAEADELPITGRS